MSSEILNFTAKLFLAGLLGGIIGYERDIHGREAGLRTHILVSMGSALFMMISVFTFEKYANSNYGSILSIDPGRIAAQIITGIGFLGAGAIIKSGVTIRGLTTAGCIWLSSALGMAVGIGFYIPALIATFFGIFVLIIMYRFEQFFEKDSFRNLKIVVADKKDIIPAIISLVKQSKINVRYCEYTKNLECNSVNISFVLRIRHKDITDKVSYALIENIEKNIKDIKSIGWERVRQ